MNLTKSHSDTTAWIHSEQSWQCGNVRVINTTDCWRIEKMYPRQYWWTLIKCFNDFMEAIEYAEGITE